MTASVEIVRAFRSLRVLVIGDAMLDTYLEGTASRLCREGPVPVVRRTAEEQVPGGAANTAANVGALGAEVMYLGLLGRDSAATALRQALTAAGVDDRWLVEEDSAVTLQKLRILADDQYVVRFDCGDTHHSSPATQEILLHHLEDAYRRCDVVVVSDYGYGVVSDAMLDRLASLRAGSPRPLLVDPKTPRRFRSARATMITPNHTEAQLAVEPTSVDDQPNRDRIEWVGRRLLDLVDADHAAITMAGDGVMLVERAGTVTHLPAHPVTRASDVGAGDSFAAATALALAAGAPPVDATRIGIDAAGIAVTKRRTAVVRQGELLQRISLTSQPAPPPVDALVGELGRLRLQGRTIVFTNGVFDILHAGHVRFLRQARSLGDVLVVGVNGDRSARRLKGQNRPVNREADRLALVAALDSVDHAVLFDEDTPTELIRRVRPHIHVKGGDYADTGLPEAEAVRDVGGRVIILPLVEDVSTSSLIERIVTLSRSDAVAVGR